MSESEAISHFLSHISIAIVGVSRNKNKFGNAVYQTLKKKGFEVLPVNPHMTHFEGVKCYSSIETLPVGITAAFINTPPEKTIKIVESAINRGIRDLWLQQGSTDETVIEFLKGKEVNFIADRCIMMFAEPVGTFHLVHRFFSKITGNFPA